LALLVFKTSVGLNKVPGGFDSHAPPPSRAKNNLRITLRDANGIATRSDRVNPFGIGKGWSRWCGRFHDTAANGFEDLAGRRVKATARR